MNNPDNDLIDLTCNNVRIVSLRANKDALGLIKPDGMDETRWLNLQKNCIIRPMRQQKEAHERAIEEARVNELLKKLLVNELLMIKRKLLLKKHVLERKLLLKKHVLVNEFLNNVLVKKKI